MSTITKERLTELSRRENVGAILGEEIAELARIALASLEAEAVACIDRANLDYLESGADADVWPASGAGSDDALLYAAPQLPQPAPEEIAMQNFRAAMEGIGHIRRTLDETFGGLRGTHCEPDVLVECKEICDAIYEAYRKTAPVTPDGWCRTCRPVTMNDMRFVVCPECGNKRCPRANDHRNACTGSNEPDQEGSAYPTAPKQEVKLALEHGMQRYAGAMQKLSEGDK